jgi:hypothetical protein
MRLEAKVLEGDQTTPVLVPLATVLAFKSEFDKPLNEAIRVDDAMDWAPWVTWHALTHKGSETRTFTDWCDAVEWVQVDSVEGPLDPSGGDSGSMSTGTESPGSSPDAESDSQTSSTTPTSSKKRSGAKRRAA